MVHPPSTGTADDADGPDFASRVEAEIPFLRRMARRWQRQAADADDLVQDTLMRALANEHSWQQGTNLRAWLIIIMRNTFFAGLARSSRAANAHTIYAASLPSQAPHAAEGRLILRDVQGALGRLPGKQRSAVLLVGVEGRSYVEVATAMGTSVGAIRCDLARARDRLRHAVHPGAEHSPFTHRLLPKPARAHHDGMLSA